MDRNEVIYTLENAVVTNWGLSDRQKEAILIAVDLLKSNIKDEFRR